MGDEVGVPPMASPYSRQPHIYHTVRGFFLKTEAAGGSLA